MKRTLVNLSEALKQIPSSEWEIDRRTGSAMTRLPSGRKIEISTDFQECYGVSCDGHYLGGGSPFRDLYRRVAEECEAHFIDDLTVEVENAYPGRGGGYR